MHTTCTAKAPRERRAGEDWGNSWEKLSKLEDRGPKEMAGAGQMEGAARAVPGLGPPTPTSGRTAKGQRRRESCLGRAQQKVLPSKDEEWVPWGTS